MPKHTGLTAHLNAAAAASLPLAESRVLKQTARRAAAPDPSRDGAPADADRRRFAAGGAALGAMLLPAAGVPLLTGLGDAAHAASPRRGQKTEQKEATPAGTPAGSTASNPGAARTTPAGQLDIAARSWTIVDVTTGMTLQSHEADLRVEPASLTKLMTAYLAFNALKRGTLTPDLRPPVSQAAWKAGGSRMFVDIKAPATVDELLHGLIIQSGNDAAMVLAEAMAGSEAHFAELMNAEAARIGMSGTRFTNASGLPDPGHYTTAADMARLAMRIIQDHPNYYRLYSEKEYTYNGIRQPNRNRLLFSDATVDGMKTGHTDAAGYCLVATARREMPGTGLSRRVLTVLTGAASENARAIESAKLLNMGFGSFEMVRVYKAGDPVSRIRVWKGQVDQLNAGFRRDVLITVPKAQAASVSGEIERLEPLVAPIAPGQKVGVVRIRSGDQVLSQVDVVALEEVPEAGLVGRAWDTVRLWMQ